MLDWFQNAAPPFIRAFLVSAIAAWPIYRALLALKSRQTVSQHVAEHAHKQGTPTMGGLIIVIGLLAYSAVMFGPHPVSGLKWAGIPVLIAGYSLIGFVDDFVVPRMLKGKRGLGWTQKLLLQIGVAGLSVFLMQPANPSAFGFGVFAILFFSNAFNFADGMDWLASTVLIAFAIGGCCLATASGSLLANAVFVAIVGATLPFMVLNRPPARIFMGDVGSMPIGGLLGLCMAAIVWPAVAPVFDAVGATQGNLGPRPWPFWAGAIVLSSVMFIELVPVPIQIASVKLFKKRVFPMTPIHHAFQKAGWKETRVVALFFAVQVVSTIVAAGFAFLGWGGNRW